MGSLSISTIVLLILAVVIVFSFLIYKLRIKQPSQCEGCGASGDFRMECRVTRPGETIQYWVCKNCGQPVK